MEKQKQIAVQSYPGGVAVTCHQDVSDELINAVTSFCAENFVAFFASKKAPCFSSFLFQPVGNEKIEDIERRFREFVATSLDGWTIRD